MNKINQIIKDFEGKYLISFKPTRAFYKKNEIGQRRWNLLLKSEVSPTIDELKKLAEYFDVKVSDLIDNN